jgi:hypothetical protein
MNQRDAIEAAFRRRPILEGKEVLLRSAIDILAGIDCTGPGTLPSQFSMVGRHRTKTELNKAAEFTGGMANPFNELHQPSILALAGAGLWKSRFDRMLTR